MSETKTRYKIENKVIELEAAPMNLNEFQELSKRTLPAHLTWEEKQLALSEYTMGLAGEVGEVIEPLKKFIYHGHTLDIYAVEEEIGDLLRYASGLASILGLHLSDIAKGNIEKINKRYPNGFKVEDSINRSE